MEHPTLMLLHDGDFQATCNDSWSKGASYFCILLFTFILFIPRSSKGQCNIHDQGYTVIINEVGNFGWTKDGPREYVELLVHGNPSNNNELIDLRGYIIDDNNAPAKDMGHEQGHIVLADCFPLVPPGSLILIYNNNAPAENINRLEDGLPNSSGVYQIPFNSPCITKIEGSPLHDNPEYWPQFGISDGKWEDFIPFNDYGDACQVRKPDGELIHSIYWYNEEYYSDLLPFLPPVDQKPTGGKTIHIDTYNQEFNGSFAFIDGGWLEESNYNQYSQGTPGTANNSNNQEYINNIINGSQSINTISGYADQGISVEDFSMSPFLNIESAMNFPLKVKVSKDGVTYLDFYVHDISIVFLDEIKNEWGTYEIVIENFIPQDQTLSFDCPLELEIIIPSFDEIESLLCEDECEEISITPENTTTLPSDCITVFNQQGEIIPSEDGTIEVCGERQDQEYITSVKNETGDIVSLEKHVIKSSNKNVFLTPSNIILCDEGESIEIKCEGEDIQSYSWSTGATTSSIIITEADEYSVTVTTTQGCEIERSRIVLEQDELHDQLTRTGYVCVPFDEINIDLNHFVHTNFSEEQAYIDGIINGEFIDINSELNEIMSQLYDVSPNVFATINSVGTCEEIVNGFKSEKPTSESREGEWLSIEMLGLKNIDPTNNNLYIKKSVDIKPKDGNPKLYVINSDQTINTNHIINEIRYFINTKINLKLDILNQHPGSTPIDYDDAICIIGDTQNSVAKLILGDENLYLNVPNLPNNSPIGTPNPCTNISDWEALTAPDDTWLDSSTDPVILVSTHSARYYSESDPDNPDTFNPYNNLNSLVNNTQRTIGFAVLHGIGHVSNIVHGNVIEGYHDDGIGFMAEGTQISQALYSATQGIEGYYIKEPRFEALINFTIKEEISIINKIKCRFEKK